MYSVAYDIEEEEKTKTIKVSGAYSESFQNKEEENPAKQGYVTETDNENTMKNSLPYSYSEENSQPDLAIVYGQTEGPANNSQFPTTSNYNNFHSSEAPLHNEEEETEQKEEEVDGDEDEIKKQKIFNRKQKDWNEEYQKIEESQIDFGQK